MSYTHIQFNGVQNKRQDEFKYVVLTMLISNIDS